MRDVLRARAVTRLADLSFYRHGEDATSLGYRARWDLVSHFLRNVEELPLETDADLAALCEMSLEAAESVVGGSLSATGARMIAVSNAVSSEVELVRGWIESHEESVLWLKAAPGFVAPLPRRVLDHSEYAALWRAFDARFPGARGSAIGSPLPWHADRRVVSDAIVLRGLAEVYLLHPTERELSTRSDPRLLRARPEDGAPHYYPPKVAYCTGPPFDFFVRIDAGADDRAAGWIEPMLRAR